MKLYNEYIKIKNRSARRKQWIGDSPIYIARIDSFRIYAMQQLQAKSYTNDRERMMLQAIADDIVCFPVTNIKFK